MANLGTLTLDLVARLGGYTAGLDKAEREAQKRAKAIEGAFDKAAIGVGVAFGLMTTAAVAAFAAISKGIETAAQFQDLAEKTGASAEGFAAMAVSAKVGGISMDELANASIKLTKNLTGVDDESKAAGAALTALGIPIDEFKKLAPEEQFKTFAVALDGFRDGAGKTAVAVAALGKSGAELLPFFKELAQADGLRKILSDEQIKQADEYSDRLTKQRALLELYVSAVATQVIPAVTAFTSALKDLVSGLTGVGTASGALAANNGMAQFAENAGRALAGLVDYIKTTISEVRALGDFIESTVTATGQLLSADLAGVRKTGADFRARYGLDEKGFGTAGKEAARTFVQQFNDQLAQGKRSSFAVTDPRRLDLKNGKPSDDRPVLKFGGAVKPAGGRKSGGAVDDPTKKLLENELANFKAMGDQAKEQLADRNKILDLYNQQGLLSVRDYYAGLKNATDDATAAQAKALDDQIASLEKFKAAAKKDTDVADTQGKINKLTEEKAKLYRQAGIEAIAMGIKEEQAAKAVKEAFNEVNAKVLEFQGNMRAAAEIRFDAQNQTLKNTFTAEGNQFALKQLATLREYTLAQADLNKAQQQFSLAQGDLQIAEERITIARERGTMGEIESLRASGVARQQAVALMEKHLAALLAINDAARSPEQVQAIERLKVQLEGLKATIDPLADKFNTMFGDAAGSAFSDFISSTKTAKEAFKSFTDSIFKQLTDLIVKDLFKQLFSADGGGTGFNLGKMLSDFFGSASGGGMFGAAKGAAAPAAADASAGGEDVLGAFIAKLGTGDVAATSAAASSTAMATAATAAATAISAMAAAASAAATALAAAAASSGSSSLGSLASSLSSSNAVGASGGDSLGSLIKLMGWSSGGFTGMGAANDPAGIVHKGEYVLDANTTKRLGVSYLNGLNNGGSTGGTSVVINQQFAAGTSRETTNQAALAASRVISRSQRNA